MKEKHPLRTIKHHLCLGKGQEPFTFSSCSLETTTWACPSAVAVSCRLLQPLGPSWDSRANAVCAVLQPKHRPWPPWRSSGAQMQSVAKRSAPHLPSFKPMIYADSSARPTPSARGSAHPRTPRTRERRALSGAAGSPWGWQHQRGWHQRFQDCHLARLLHFCNLSFFKHI